MVDYLIVANLKPKPNVPLAMLVCRLNGVVENL
jgi:hypothetical protein